MSVFPCQNLSASLLLTAGQTSGVWYLPIEVTLSEKSGGVKINHSTSLQMVPSNTGLNDVSKRPSYAVYLTQSSQFRWPCDLKRGSARIAGSIPTECMDVRLLCLLCLV